MIIIDKPTLKFLRAGRAVNVTSTRNYRAGYSYAIGLTHKRTVCRALIVDSTQTSDGTWTLILKQDLIDRPIFLAANPAGMRSDYTYSEARAARGTDRQPIEAVGSTRDDAAWLQKRSREAADRDDQIRRERAHRERIERKRR